MSDDQYVFDTARRIMREDADLLRRLEPHDRFENDRDAYPEWQPPSHPWCTSCCVPLGTCGCPTAEAELDRIRTIHLDGMGV